MEPPQFGTSKCSRCSEPILDGQFALHPDGTWVHFWCWRILASQESIRQSRGLRRLSEAAIAHSAAVIAQLVERIDGHRPSHAPVPLRSVACRLDIAASDEVEVLPAGPIHRRCKPESD
jgi:hypothetical protein